MPKDSSLWPHVDIFIPTYNEPLDVVKPTCLRLSDDGGWPKEKLLMCMFLMMVAVLRFEEFSNSVGAGYYQT